MPLCGIGFKRQIPQRNNRLKLKRRQVNYNMKQQTMDKSSFTCLANKYRAFNKAGLDGCRQRVIDRIRGKLERLSKRFYLKLYELLTLFNYLFFNRILVDLVVIKPISRLEYIDKRFYGIISIR